MRVFTDSEVRALLQPAEVVNAVESAFARNCGATAVLPERTQLPVDDHGLLLVMPCYDSALPALGVKLISVFENAAQRLQATYVLLDPASGKLHALMAANYLTEVRTAAASAVATRHMARQDASTLGVFGTGRQARSHIEVFTAVRNFERVLVCGSSKERSEEFASAMARTLNREVEPAEARACASQADVICTCTSSPSPVFDGKWLPPGAHLNLVGAFQPTKREVDSETTRRARIAVDIYGALAEAGDLLIPMREGVISRAHIVADLHELASGKKPGRTSAEEITVFKSVGCALEDLVIASLVWQKAEAQRL